MTRAVPAAGIAAALALLTPAAPSAQIGAAAGVPAPGRVIGFEPCADYKLATYEQIAGYFRRLDAASDRMELVEIGRTVEGRTQLMAVISSEANLKHAARYKEIARRLALARDLTDEAARALAREGRAVVWIDFGLHSTEVGHAQTAPRVAYAAVTDDSAEMRFIRDNVIFLLVPNMNPDGTTLVSEWFMKHVGTPYERSSPPTLYHKYVGHDNNRDWFMFNMPESQNVARQLYVEWFPQIVYNHHQAAPFPARIFVPPFADPMNPNIPPLVMRGVNTVGDAISRRLDQEGKRGAISRVGFDTWWNGGMRTAPYFHNMIGILTETAHASAIPATYDPKAFPRTFANGAPTLEPTTYYPSPYRGGEWHLRDTCAYMTTASLAVLDIGAKRREEWLYDIYQMGRDAIGAGARETYLIPADQWDPGAAIRLVNVLRWGAIEVERATASFTAGGRAYPPGSFVIRGAQPFRAHLTDLLNPQEYPDRRLYPGGPPERPYDITGWTLSRQMGVEVIRLEGADADLRGGAFEQVERAAALAGAAAGRADFAYVVDARANAAFVLVNRLLKAGDHVYRAAAAFGADGASWPAGTFLVAVGAGTHERLEASARELGLRVTTIGAAPPVRTLRVRPPRVGLYQAWGGNIDEGWTRWLLEQFEFPYATVHDAGMRAGGLGAAYDVIVLPDASYESMLTGLAAGSMPPEYTGGMTPTGVANLYEFVAAGGTLVALDSAAELPLTAFGLPVRDVTANQREADFFIPGTLLRLAVDATHPVAYGMPAEVAAFFARSPAFAVGQARSRVEEALGEPPPAPAGIRIVARYPAQDLLVSGWLLGERIVAGHAAVIDASLGRGRVLLLGFRTQHRGQPHATFKLLFNSLYVATAAEEAVSRPTTDPGARPDR